MNLRQSVLFTALLAASASCADFDQPDPAPDHASARQLLGHGLISGELLACGRVIGGRIGLVEIGA
jgi:hypothetical protein